MSFGADRQLAVAGAARFAAGVRLRSTLRLRLGASLSLRLSLLDTKRATAVGVAARLASCVKLCCAVSLGLWVSPLRVPLRQRFSIELCLRDVLTIALDTPHRGARGAHDPRRRQPITHSHNLQLIAPPGPTLFTLRQG
jgi:hypothetical protein